MQIVRIIMTFFLVVAPTEGMDGWSTEEVLSLHRFYLSPNHTKNCEKNSKFNVGSSQDLFDASSFILCVKLGTQSWVVVSINTIVSWICRSQMVLSAGR